MLNKILCIIMLGSIAGLSSASAQAPATAAATAPAKVKGRIIAGKVEGHVEVIFKATNVSRPLKEGEQIGDETEVVTSPGAKAILVFSNGATVNLAEDSTLDIAEFLQDPFAADQKVSEMTNEPGTSITKLDLTKGELVGKVVHLNVDQGSEFTVQTPVGAAGIRGTIFRIIFRPDPKNPGHVFFSVVTTDGKVVLQGVTGSVSIPAGKKVVVADFSYTPPSSTGGTGGTGTGGTGTGGTGTGGTGGGTGTTTPPITIVTTDLSPTDAAAIQTVSQGIENTVINLVISNSSTGSGTGSGGSGSGTSGSGSGSGGSGSGNSGSGSGGSGSGSGNPDTGTSNGTTPNSSLTGGAGLPG
jgi:hypothetical protein